MFEVVKANIKDVCDECGVRAYCVVEGDCITMCICHDCTIVLIKEFDEFTK